MCVRKAFRMRNFWAVIALIAAPALADDGQQVAAKEARTFLLRYVGLTATSNIAALDLYRDDARVRVVSYNGEREAAGGLVQGKDWKQQLRAGWFDGTTRLESSSFASASVVRDGERLIIRARRYSQANCYWDNGYGVAIEPDRFGQYQIVEERISFQRASACPAAAKNGPPTLSTLTPAVPVQVAPSAASVAVPSGSPTGSRLPPNVIPIDRDVPSAAQAHPTPALPSERQSQRSMP